jgi:hypothetical protein
MTIFETYAVACPSVLGASGSTGFGGFGLAGTGIGGFAAAPNASAHAQFAGTDARMEKTAKAAVMLPARPWESTPPREPSRF